MHRTLICALVLLVVSGRCEQEPLDGNGSPACCPQEMCFYIFDRLEEQIQRWKNVEQVLRRTVSLLSSTERLTDVGTALKADPVISALFKSEEYSNANDSPDWEVEPVILIYRSQQNSTESRSHGRTKRQLDTNKGILAAREKLAEALSWAKKGKTSLGQEPIRIVEPVPIPRIASQPRAPTVAMEPVKETTTVLPVAEAHDADANSSPIKEASSVEKSLATQQFVRETVGNLQSATKCALAQRNDANFTENLGVLDASRATLHPNKTVTLEFELKTCHKYFTAILIRLYEHGAPFVYNPQKLADSNDSSSFIQVPKDCLKKMGNVFSLSLPSNRKACSFPFMALMECKVYNIEMTPIYQGLQGQQSFVDITVPPEQLLGYSTSLNSVKALSNNSMQSKINLQWSVNSADCAQLLTSVDVRIYEDIATTVPLQSYTLPSNCFKSTTDNYFVVDELADFCFPSPVTPLEGCRTYKLELEPEYASSWKGKSSVVALYITGVGGSNVQCNFLTSSSGSFRSTDNDATYDSTWFISVEPNNTIWLTFSQFYIEGSYYRVKVFDGPSSSSLLLLDQYGSQPPTAVRSSTNKMLVQLASQYYRQSYGKHFTAYYAAVPKSGIPYAAGCGGYINFVAPTEIVGVTTITKPTYPTTEPNTSVCLWYIESSYTNQTILLNSLQGKSSFPMIVYDGWSEDNVVYEQGNKNGSSRAVIFTNGNKMMVKFPEWNTADRTRSYSWKVGVAVRQVNWSPCHFNLTSNTGTIKSVNYPSAYSGSLDCRWTIQVNNTSKVRLTFVFFDTEADYDFVTVYDGSSITAPMLSEISGSMTSPVSVTSTSDRMTVRFTAVADTSEASRNYYGYDESSARNYGRKPRSGFLALYSTVPCDCASSEKSS